MSSRVKSVLVLGGTAFIGRAFCRALIDRTRFRLTLLNRGQTHPNLFPKIRRLRCDRNDPESCRRALAEFDAAKPFDAVVDFSGQRHAQIQNVIASCVCEHYTYLSSSAVDLATPDDPYFSMAQHKLWCEHLLANRCDRLLIVRPGFVVGPHDYTHRFQKDGVTWHWRGTQTPVRPLIEVGLLVNVMLRLIEMGHTGVVRAGYSMP